MERENICIIGAGYVGLTLGAVMAEKGFTVRCIEKNVELVKKLNEGKPHFHEKGLAPLMKKHLKKSLSFDSNIPLEGFNTFIICVGTPLDFVTKKPILQDVLNVAEELSTKMPEDSLIIFRSTVPVGFSRKQVVSKLNTSGKKYLLAFCPERTIEGKALIELKEIPQIIGGLDEDSVKQAKNLFRKITPTVIEVDNLETAEMIKLLNNAYRDLTFSFANEIALVCEDLGLNAVQTIRAANIGYNRSYIPTPGPVGGTCLKKDPHIYVDSVREGSTTPQLVQVSRNINESVPEHIITTIIQSLSEANKKLEKCKVFISGFAFKGNPPTSDFRNSVTLDIVKSLNRHGVKYVYAHDFVASHHDLDTLSSQLGVTIHPVKLKEGFRKADIVIIANNHESYEAIDLEQLLDTMQPEAIFYDCWCLFEPQRFQKVKYLGFGIG